MASQSLSISHTSKGGFCWIWFCMALHCFKDYQRITFSFDLKPNCPATKAECVRCLSWHLWLMHLQTVSLPWWKISARYSCLDKIDFLGKKKRGNCCWWYWEFLRSFAFHYCSLFLFLLPLQPFISFPFCIRKSHHSVQTDVALPTQIICWIIIKFLQPAL